MVSILGLQAYKPRPLLYHRHIKTIPDKVFFMKAFIVSSPMGIPIDGSRACPILLRHEKATVLLHNACISEYDYE